MTSVADSKVKSVPFSGKKGDFYGWTVKFLSYCHSQGCKDVLNGVTVPPTDADYRAITDPKKDAALIQAKKANDLAMALLNLSLSDKVSQCAVQNAANSEYSEGLASLAWTNLRDIYRPISVARCNELEMEFTNCILSSNSKNPDEWFAELDYIKQQLITDYKKQDIYTPKKIIHHILYNVKCGMYNSILTGLRRDETIRAREELAATAAAPYDANKHIIALAELKREFREHYALMSQNYPNHRKVGDRDALLLSGGNGKKYKKPYKQDCRVCGVKGHKGADCWNNPQNAHKRKVTFKKEVAVVMSDKTQNPKKCNFCKKDGHLESECWKKNRNEKMKNGPGSHAAAAVLISMNALQFTRPKLNINLSSIQKSQITRDTFIADTGATCHMRGSKEGMYDMVPFVSDIVVGSGAIIKSVSRGSYKGVVLTKTGKEISVILTDVLYIPDLWVNLISITKAISNPAISVKSTKTGCLELQFGTKQSIIFDKEIINGNGHLLGVDIYPTPPASALTAFDHAKPVDINKLHEILGHANNQVIHATCHKYGIKHTNELQVCPNCAIAKAKQKNLPQRAEPKSTVKGERINIDISSVNGVSYGGSKYWLLLQDDFTGYLWTTFLKHKSELSDYVIKWVQLLHKETGVTIKSFRLDDGGENTKLREMVRQHPTLNIKFEFTASGTPQQNGKVERMFATLYGKTRSMLNSARFTTEIRRGLWSQCANHAVQLQNIIVMKHGEQ